MTSDSGATEPAGTDAPAGDLDKDVKKIHDLIRTRGDDVPEYIRILKSGGLIERRKSAEALGEIGDERGVLPLIDATQDPSSDVRYVAIKALGMLGDRRAVDTLIGALKSDEKWLRLGAAHSLGHIGDAKAVESLLPLLGAREDRRRTCDHTSSATGAGPPGGRAKGGKNSSRCTWGEDRSMTLLPDLALGAVMHHKRIRGSWILRKTGG
ncbi:MAG: HEAT repeat domain-containing protein [Methanoregulaceae archaeon]